MKKIFTLIVMIFTIMLSNVVFAHTENDPYRTDLIAGGGSLDSAMHVGDVLVWNDADYLYVKYIITDPDWCITEIPQTKKGNPIPGHFEYSGMHNRVSEYTVMIQNEWDTGTSLLIAAHASIIKEVVTDNITTYLKETAWGAGLDFPGKNWATYFAYIIQAQSPNPECEGATCENFIPCEPAGGCVMPICATIAEGGGVCVEGTTPCNSVDSCTSSDDCPDGFCVVETCCGEPVCAPSYIWCVNIPETAAATSVLLTDEVPTLGSK